MHCPNLYWAYADAMSDSYSVSFDQKDVMDDEYDEEGAKMVLKPTEESKVDNSSCKADVPEDEEYEVLPHCSYVNNEFKEKFSFQIRKNKNTNEIDIINISHDWTGVNYAVYSEFEFKNFEFKCPSYLSFEENKALGAFHSGDFLVTPSNTETDWKYVGETNYASDNKILLSYVEYSGSGKLQCSKGGSSVINCEKEGQLIEIGSIDKYIDILSGTNVENYPRYIVEYVDENNNYTYKFADYSDKDANVNYINLNHVGDLFKTGGDIDKTCKDLLGIDFLNFLNNNVLKIIYIGIPILLIVLTTFDFAKVVFVDDKDGISSAGKKFGKRVIAAFLIYLVPTILILGSNIFANNEISKCAKTLKDLTETIDN